MFEKRVWKTTAGTRPRRTRRGSGGSQGGEAAADHRRRRRALSRRRGRARRLRRKHGVPVAETQAGKSSMPATIRSMGSVGVTGRRPPTRWPRRPMWSSPSARGLPDFTTGSWALFKNPEDRCIGAQRAGLRRGQASRAAAGRRRPQGLTALPRRWMPTRRLPPTSTGEGAKADWKKAVDAATAAPAKANQRAALRHAGDRRGAARAGAGVDRGLRRRRAARRTAQALAGRQRPAATTSNTAIPAMGYEIAGGLGVKMARPERDVVVMVGDGSYLMMNSEIATSVMLGPEAHIVVLDNRGFGCINRLQRRPAARASTTCSNDAHHVDAAGDRLRRPRREPRRHRRARSTSIAELEAALRSAQGDDAHHASSSSTPTRWRPPRPAGIGGTSAVPEVSRARRARRPQGHDEASKRVAR